jgi:hypothetical protein
MWLSAEILNLGCFAAGGYRSLKRLKDNEVSDLTPLAISGRTVTTVSMKRSRVGAFACQVDFDLLVFWAVLGSLQLYGQYLEWLFSWFPFYW